MILEVNNSYKGNCVELMKFLPDESIDVILTDPPYLYLKNQKLDRTFDESEYFKQVKRVLKKDGFIVLFGRGTSFYRWNTTLADLGFTFKEEIIWDKSYCSSPLMAMSRIHETISIHTKGKGTINKVKVPYLEMKGHDIPSICQDIKRMRSVFRNTKSLDAVLAFLENNQIPNDGTKKNISTTVSSIVDSKDRGASVMKCIMEGMNEKSIIRSDREECNNFTKFGVNSDKRKTGDRCVNSVQSIVFGLNEKSIIRELRNHYKAIHPTEKPVRLLERLLALVCKVEQGKPKPLILDTFRGSASTDIACMNFGVDYISFEIDDEYFDKGEERKAEYIKNLQPDLFKQAL